MAKKTNYEVNGVKYNRKRVKIDGEQKLFLGKSQAEIEQKIEAYKAKPKLDCFDVIFRDWLEYVKRPEISPSSFVKYEQIYRLHISGATFVSKELDEISDLDLQKHINALDGSGTIKATRDILKSFFIYCINTRKLVYNPMITVTMPKKAYVEPEKKYLTIVDIDKLTAAFKSDRNLFIYIFIMSTGLRRGEMSALKIKDIDLDKMVVKVYKSLNRLTIDGKSETLVSHAKTPSSIREIPIAESLLPAIKEHILAEKKKHFKHGLPFDDECFMFTSSICTPIRGDRVTSRWEKIQTEIGIEPVTLHGLRHTFGTILAKKGVPIQVVSKLLGHSDIKTTISIYTHIDDEQKHDAISKLDVILSG